MVESLGDVVFNKSGRNQIRNFDFCDLRLGFERRTIFGLIHNYSSFISSEVLLIKSSLWKSGRGGGRGNFL